MLMIPGLGPHKAKAIYDALGIASIGELAYACNENRLVDLPGFGEKTQKNILAGIKLLEKHSGRFLYPFALTEAQAPVAPLEKSGNPARRRSPRRRGTPARSRGIPGSDRDAG